MTPARGSRRQPSREGVVRIAFDSRPAADVRGVGRYARCLLGALRETAPERVEIVETHRPTASSRTGALSLFHAPWLEGAVLRSPCPMVVTIHDLSALTRVSEHLRNAVKLRLKHLAVQRAVHVIVPTETVAHDAVEHLGLERRRISVIAEAADPVMGPRSEEDVASVKRRLKLPERYLLWVGSLRHPDPRRQVAKLAATPHKLPLVLVGPTRPWAHQLPDVTLTGQVSDDELAAIYSGAHALVLPSDSEGFGLPAVEALACGTPVAACGVPALKEALGARASFVEAGDLKALVEAAEAARRPAPAPPPWSWRDAARETWRVYREAGLEGAALHQDGGHGLEKDRDVKRQRPALQVDEI